MYLYYLTTGAFDSQRVRGDSKNLALRLESGCEQLEFSNLQIVLRVLQLELDVLQLELSILQFESGVLR
jgi:hypothetical protein